MKDFVRVALVGSSLSLFALGACDERIDPMVRDARSDTGVAQEAGGDAMAEPDGAVVEDSATMTPDATVEDGASGADGGARCVPNNDGIIERAELPYVVGAQVIFAVNEDGSTVMPVNTAGAMGASGWEWDFSATRATDRRTLDEVQAPTGKWWSSLYPSATFALPINRASSLSAVYHSTDSALQILATVSRDTGITNVAFNPAIDAIRFPLRVGSTWTVTSAGNGLYNGVGTSTVNSYRFTVDKRGTVLTPATRFDALRLRMELDQTVTGTVIRRTVRTYLYLSECWGLVARIASQDNETAVEFTTASEYRRLGL